MTRLKAEFTVTIKDGDDEGFRAFASQLQHFVDDNVPANSGWSKLTAPTVKAEVDPLWGTTTADPRWKGILDKVDEMAKSFPQLERGVGMESGRGVITCKAVFYNDATCTTKSLYLISAYANTIKSRGPLGQIIVEVDGPYEDAGDQYWHNQAEYDKGDRPHIITPDWNHYTLLPDVGSAERESFAGHGGTEFKFILRRDVEWQKEFVDRGICVVQMGDALDASTEHNVVVSRNVWAQGVIPDKHHHLFKVNARRGI